MMRRWFGVFVVLAVVSAACAGDSGGPPATAPPTTGGVTVTTPDVVEPPATVPAHTSTTGVGSGWPAVEVLATNDDGVFLIDANGEISHLVKGRVAYAVDDTRGGLLFQVERDRSMAWWGGGHIDEVKDTRVWWVPQGADEAVELLVPTPGLPLDLSLIDAVVFEGRTLILYERHDSTMEPEYGPHGWLDSVRVFDLDSGDVAEVFTFSPWEEDWDFATGGGLVVADVQGQGAPACFFLESGLSENVRLPPSATTFWDLEPVSFDPVRSRCVLSPDGRLLARVEGDSYQMEDQHVVVEEVVSGAVVAMVPGAADALDVDDEYLVMTMQGWSRLIRLADVGESIQVPIKGQAHLVSGPVDVESPVVPPTPAAIQLRADGLGVVDFGDPVGEAGEALAGVLRESDASPEGILEWSTPALAVVSNRLDVSTGASTETLLLTNWYYWGSGDDPGVTLATPEGITIGSNVADLRSAYGDDLWVCPQMSEQGEVSWGWMTTAGIPTSWDRWWRDGSFGLSGWFDRNPEDPNAQVVGLTAGWRLADHMCVPPG